MTYRLVLLILACLLTAPSGCKKQMSGRVRLPAMDALKALKKLTAELRKSDGEFRKVVAEEPALMKSHPEGKEALRLMGVVREELKELLAWGRKLKRFVNKNDKKDEAATDALRLSISKRRRELKGLPARALKKVRELLHAKRQAPALVRQVTADLKRSQGIPGAELAKAVADAGEKLPPFRKALLDRLEGLRRKSKNVADMAKAHAKASAAPGVDYLANAHLAARIHQEADGLVKAVKKLKSGLGELHYSLDKILIDMRGQGGQYAHRYKMVRNCKVSTSLWFEVTAGQYFDNRDHLGMSIYSKPKGVMSADAVTLATPPGYSYVGNPIYGQWKESKWIERHWVFHKEYDCLKKIFWGKDYRKVQHKEHLAFEQARKLKKVWFGGSPQKGPEYGTSSARVARLYKPFYVRRAAVLKQLRTQGARIGGPHGRVGGYGK